MKKLFFSSVIVFVSLFLVSTPSNAQKFMPEPFITSVDSSDESNKPGADKSEINSKVLKSFNRKYKTSANVVWSPSAELIQAYFKENGKQTRVFYNSKGRWIRTIFTYGPELLSSDLESIVKRNFWKYEIKWISEVHEGDMQCYFVNIENGRNFKQVVVYDGETFVYKQYKIQ